MMLIKTTAFTDYMRLNSHDTVLITMQVQHAIDKLQYAW